MRALKALWGRTAAPPGAIPGKSTVKRRSRRHGPAQEPTGTNCNFPPRRDGEAK
jgi:hypothetical protein